MWQLNWITLGAVILSFLPNYIMLPFYTGDLGRNDSPINNSLQDTIYIYSLIFGMGMAVPYMLEIFYEIFIHYIRRKQIMDDSLFIRW